jgi:hypothetical protein
MRFGGLAKLVALNVPEWNADADNRQTESAAVGLIF